MVDNNYSRNSVHSSGLISGNSISTGGGGGGGGGTDGRSLGIRDDSSCSDDGIDSQSVHFFLGPAPTPLNANRHSGYQSFESINSTTPNHVGSTTPMIPISPTPVTSTSGSGTQMHNSHAVMNSNDR